MPHQPRRYPNTLGILQELQQPAQESHTVMPKQEEQQKAGVKRINVGLDKINIHGYEPDFQSVCRSLFGREFDVDKNTGGLVSRGPAGQQPPIGSQQ